MSLISEGAKDRNCFLTLTEREPTVGSSVFDSLQWWDNQIRMQPAVLMLLVCWLTERSAGAEVGLRNVLLESVKALREDGTLGTFTWQGM